MWKRVSDEIEKPILAPMPRFRAAQPEEVSVEPEAFTVNEIQPVPPEPAPETPPTFESEPEAAALPETEEPQSAGADSIEADITILLAEAEAPAMPAAEELEPEPEPYVPPIPAAPPAEPSLIGRYEAEGTAYLMFDDGSIEAQSEAGVFRFASMADLKAFIEEKQAVE